MKIVYMTFCLFVLSEGCAGAECGKVTPEGSPLIAGGESAKHAEVPWHAGIYSKTTRPYSQLCGGTLISNKVIISAAHCFWDYVEENGTLPADSFAVAVGKLYRPWNDEMDEAQKSDVKEVHIPERFHGRNSHFQQDIAVVIAADPFQFNRFVRPACVDFDEKLQLKPGNKGKVAGWGLTTESDSASHVLKVIDQPYIDIGTCISESPDDFRPFITADKFCAGYKNGSTVCSGDGGGGLVFNLDGAWYLRGVVSVSSVSKELGCDPGQVVLFTDLALFLTFIRENMSD